MNDPIAEHVPCRWECVTRSVTFSPSETGSLMMATDVLRQLDYLRARLDVAIDDADRMTVAWEEAIRQRDKARRLLCNEIWLSRGGRTSVEAIAAERGWDCFKEDGND